MKIYMKKIEDKEFYFRNILVRTEDCIIPCMHCKIKEGDTTGRLCSNIPSSMCRESISGFVIVTPEDMRDADGNTYVAIPDNELKSQYNRDINMITTCHKLCEGYDEGCTLDHPECGRHPGKTYFKAEIIEV